MEWRSRNKEQHHGDSTMVDEKIELEYNQCIVSISRQSFVLWLYQYFMVVRSRGDWRRCSSIVLPKVPNGKHCVLEKQRKWVWRNVCEFYWNKINGMVDDRPHFEHINWNNNIYLPQNKHYEHLRHYKEYNVLKNLDWISGQQPKIHHFRLMRAILTPKK
jgi:hypothetical protein